MIAIIESFIAILEKKYRIKSGKFRLYSLGITKRGEALHMKKQVKKSKGEDSRPLYTQVYENTVEVSDGYKLNGRHVTKENIKRAIQFLIESNDENYSLKDAAKIADLSPYHFIRVFKAQTGKTPYNYFMDLKIRKAKELLEVLEHSVTEICFYCGFSNLSHFSTVFKKRVGVSPKEYRKRIHSDIL